MLITIEYHFEAFVYFSSPSWRGFFLEKTCKMLFFIGFCIYELVFKICSERLKSFLIKPKRLYRISLLVSFHSLFKQTKARPGPPLVLSVIIGVENAVWIYMACKKVGICCALFVKRVGACRSNWSDNGGK